MNFNELSVYIFWWGGGGGEVLLNKFMIALQLLMIVLQLR